MWEVIFYTAVAYILVMTVAITTPQFSSNSFQTNTSAVGKPFATWGMKTISFIMIAKSPKVEISDKTPLSSFVYETMSLKCVLREIYTGILPYFISFFFLIQGSPAVTGTD